MQTPRIITDLRLGEEFSDLITQNREASAAIQDGAYQEAQETMALPRIPALGNRQMMAVEDSSRMG